MSRSDIVGPVEMKWNGASMWVPVCVPRDSAETFDLECGPMDLTGRHSKDGCPSHTFTVDVREWLRSMIALGANITKRDD